MVDMKMTDQSTRHENAGREFDGPNDTYENARHEIARHEITRRENARPFKAMLLTCIQAAINRQSWCCTMFTLGLGTWEVR